MFRRRIIVKVVIADEIGANPYEQTIELSRFRYKGEIITERWLIDQIEQYIEHEHLHILFFNLLDTETCLRFDLIEYPTFVIWNKRIPRGFDFKIKNTPISKWCRRCRQGRVKKETDEILDYLKRTKEEYDLW